MNLLAPFAAAAVLLFFFISPRRNLLKKLKEELRERFVLYPASDVPKDALWLHAASVGEVNSVTALITQIKAFYNKPLVITTNTWAGRVAALKNPSVDAAFLMPLDFFFISRKFARRMNPYRMFVVEGELWPNAIMQAAAAGAKIIILNGRMSPKSAKKYRLIRPLYALLMSKIFFGTFQNADIMNRYVSLGLKAENAFDAGNVKYDSLNQNPARAAEVRALFAKLGWAGKTVLVCGSTHPSEEEMIFKALPALYENGIRAVIAPRHLERKESITNTLSKQKTPFALLSKAEASPADPAILFADAMGWLSSFYAAADITFVGGTVTPKGGHNLLESAVLAKPVLLGPSVYNTPDTAEKLLASGAGVLINKDTFLQTALDLNKNKEKLNLMGARARQTALSFQGAGKKIMELIENYERK